jgi:Ran GTPase-activating protein (RanGAP) involved in mRNA processing and transport
LLNGVQDTENVYTLDFRMFTQGAKRISKGLHKRWKPLRNVYTKDAYLENKFTQEVRKHEKKFTFLQIMFTQFIKKKPKSLH